MNTAWATVATVAVGPPGCFHVECRLDDGTAARAVAYVVFTPTVRVGDRVLLNTTAEDLGLGSGGAHFVKAVEGAAAHREAMDRAHGHILKLRYTPLQTRTLAAEEPASPWHDTLKDADDLDGMPVVCCELLSQAAPALAGLLYGEDAPRVAVVMTDEAALPAAYVETLAALRERGLIAGVVTAGQAFGGDLEAVNVHSALLAARAALNANAVIVTPGPGTVGTGTRWGFGGVAQGEALNAAFAMRGTPVGVVRASGAEGRGRHHGASHHTRTVFSRVALAPFHAAWPAGAGDEFAPDWEALIRAAPFITPHRVEGAGAALDAMQPHWNKWRSMGRGRAEDPLFFEAAAAAGILARELGRERT